MNAVIAHVNQSALTALDMRAQVQRIQEVMAAVMKEGVHFGTVPGTGKPSLWKPGAEVLGATFHIASSYRTEDLSDGDSIRYRVTCIGTHQPTSTVMGEGMGECSTNEEKYKWRRAYRREFDNTDPTRRRIKYGWDKEKREEYEIQQVRTEPSDLANTVLKMACKRAQVAMMLNVTAASDTFTQDVEDLPEEIREAVQSTSDARRRKASTSKPRAASGSNTNRQSGVITDAQLKLLRTKMEQSGMSAEDLCKRYSIESVDKLPFDKMNDALAYIKDPQREAIEAEADDAN